jgi:iron complex transport system ATP-binding protein
VLLQGSKPDVLTDASLSDAFGIPLEVRQHGNYYTAVAI